QTANKLIILSLSHAVVIISIHFMSKVMVLTFRDNMNSAALALSSLLDSFPFHCNQILPIIIINSTPKKN
ncbi:MAG: hypothetical protein MJE68_12985, partial [Proteobacteria bacterium]|nr:hypothetical protein [Pseudomonadota bacterium]